MSITTIADITPIMNCFIRMGINIDASPNQNLFNYPERFLAALIGTIVWTYAIINYGITYLNDVDRLVGALTIVTPVFLAIIKQVLFLMRARRFIQLLKRFERLASKGNTVEREMYGSKTSRIMRVVGPYSIACWTTVAIAVAVPLIRLLVNYILYTEIDMTLALPGIFPYDHTTTFNYIVTNIFTIQLMYFSINTLVIVEGLYGWFIINVSALFDIIRLKLERSLETYNRLNDLEFKYCLAQVIEYHNETLELAAEFDAVFAEIVFAEVTCGCFLICFLVFQFAFSTDPSIYPFFSMFLTSIVYQLMIYCFGGEMVKNENEDLCDLVYLLVPWPELSPRTQKALVMPMIRTRRPMTITGYFFTADRNLLVWIFRTAGSFTALLFALKDKELTI